MEHDAMGNPVCYVVYDRSREGTTTGFWMVATFYHCKNAREFLEEQDNENYFVSCQQGTKKLFSLARD
jgi:hypothetical protein